MDREDFERMTPTPEHRTNRLLGYPDDARLLILNADDFGMCHSVNEGILGTLTDGVVTSTTLMTPCPWAPQAMAMLKEHPQIAFGVHLTLVSDFGVYRWGPVASKDRVGSLVDESGFFYRYERKEGMIDGATLDELELEFRAQIGTVLVAGLQPTHLDWHCLADGGSAEAFELTVRLAEEFGLAMRVHGRAHAAALQRRGLPTADHEVLDSYHMIPSEKPARYAQMLRALPAGLTEWAIHPSLGNAESQALEPETWQVRRADFDYFVSQEAREVLEEEGIVLLDYRPLQAVWNR